MIEKLVFQNCFQIKCQHILAGSLCTLCQAVTGSASGLRQVRQLLWTSSQIMSCLAGEETGVLGSVMLLTTFTKHLSWFGKENEVLLIISNGRS